MLLSPQIFLFLFSSLLCSSRRRWGRTGHDLLLFLMMMMRELLLWASGNRDFLFSLFSHGAVCFVLRFPLHGGFGTLLPEMDHADGGWNGMEVRVVGRYEWAAAAARFLVLLRLYLLRCAWSALG